MHAGHSVGIVDMGGSGFERQIARFAEYTLLEYSQTLLEYSQRAHAQWFSIVGLVRSRSKADGSSVAQVQARHTFSSVLRSSKRILLSRRLGCHIGGAWQLQSAAVTFARCPCAIRCSGRGRIVCLRGRMR